MSSPARVAQATLLVVAAALLAVAAAQLRRRRQVADRTVDDIHRQLDALDPVTRAAVVARLNADQARQIHDHIK